MNLKLIYIFLFLAFISCQNRRSFPAKKSERILTDNTTENLLNNTNGRRFETLFTFVKQFESQDVAFDLQAFENEYTRISAINTWNKIDTTSLTEWIELTGFLLELTGEEKYAEALEELSKVKGVSNYFRPFIFTKNVDHIYVNLFNPIEISYQHTLGEKITFRLESSYPESGSIQLHAETTGKSYVEVYIRIPEWADGATVTEKRVKYLAKPGSYCKIAKKWNNGDFVEIELPMENYPKQ
ncbi:MAG TPA: hypothetical protein VEP89_14135 [Draconibacterium sp.]|nr:hypothetical protein [Draconibacterium sp.]